MSTVFSKIVSGEAAADIVYKDERVTAFRDINPVAPTHILVVPNKIISTVNDLEQEDAALVGHMVLAAKKLAAEEGIAEQGYRLIINCNRDGGQVVFHLHLHLIELQRPAASTDRFARRYGSDI
jgi:histidine triad (HIT) family protein